MQWTTQRPSEPGWYWYSDELYGPAPVYVDWTGFVDDTAAHQLAVVDCCLDEDTQPLCAITDLEGRWAGPLAMPDDEPGTAPSSRSRVRLQR